MLQMLTVDIICTMINKTVDWQHFTGRLYKISILLLSFPSQSQLPARGREVNGHSVCSSLSRWLESVRVTTRDKRFVFYGLLPLLPNVAPLQRDALICHLIW